MRPFLIAITLLLGLAAVLFATGAFDVIREGTLGDDEQPSIAEDTEDGGIDRSTGLMTTPKEQPEAYIPKLREPASALFIARRPGVFSLRTVGALSATQNLSFQTWYTVSTEAASSLHAPGPGPAKGNLGALGGPPDGAYLEDHDVRAVVVHDIDPNALPLAFWEALAERVASKRTGLWVGMSVPQSDAGEGLAIHPLLTHPVLAPLLPIGETPTLDSDPVPGLLFDAKPFAVTDAGTKHPASRLTPWPRWSRTFWEQTRTGPNAWSTKFSYPVVSLVDDAKVLLEVEVRAVERLPALVVFSDEGPRVLWQSFPDFGRPAYMHSGSNMRMGAWIGQVVEFLVGQATF